MSHGLLVSMVARDNLRGALGVQPALVRPQSFPPKRRRLGSLDPGDGRPGDLPGTRTSHPFAPLPAPHRLAVLRGRTGRGAGPLFRRVRHLRPAGPARLCAGWRGLGLARLLDVGTVQRPSSVRGAVVPKRSATFQALAARGLAGRYRGCGDGRRGGVVAHSGVQCLLHREPFRYRELRERQQIKWLAYAASVVVLGSTLAYGVHGATGIRWSWQVGITLLAIGLVGTPIAVGIAISRHRLYEIDTLINRTLVYGSLMAAMAGIYEITLVTVQHVLLALTHVEHSQLAYFATAMVMAAVFEPLKRRIDAFVERYLLERDARAGP